MQRDREKGGSRGLTIKDRITQAMASGRVGETGIADTPEAFLGRLGIKCNDYAKSILRGNVKSGIVGRVGGCIFPMNWLPKK